MYDWCALDQAAEQYARLIHYRVRDGMLINDWEVDWDHQPLTHAYYETPDVHSIPLPTATCNPLSGSFSSSPDTIGALLYSVYGFTGFRLVINRNDKPAVYLYANATKFGRHTASGGGRYCADFYLVESGRGDHGSLPAGIYHYSPLRHVWETLTSGDATLDVAHAQRYAESCDRYVIMTIDYWRSGFKYNDFCYQATAMDIGTIIGSVAEAVGSRTARTWDMWVNETELARILHLDPLRNGVYVVQSWGSSTRLPVNIPDSATQSHFPEKVGSLFPKIVDFTTTTALQADMRRFPQRPDSFTHALVSNELTEGVDAAWWNSLHARQSSFGRFTGESYSLESLLALLHSADAACYQLVGNETQDLRWQYLVYVTNIDGLVPGLYIYCPASHELKLFSAEPQDDFLASTYFLKNYDGRKAAATIIPCGNVFECSHEWGVRGYRLVNAVIGAACQAISVEAVRQGIGTGTALGFDGDAHAQRAELDKDVMTPMLMIMTGVDHPLAGEFHTDASLVRSAR